MQIQLRSNGNNLLLEKRLYKCHEPSKKKSTECSQNYLQLLEDKNEAKANEAAWSLLKRLSLSLSADVPTWVAYYSLLASKPVTTIVTMLPIINGNPTSLENLYTALKNAKKLKNRIFKDGNTVP